MTAKSETDLKLLEILQILYIKVPQSAVACFQNAELAFLFDKCAFCDFAKCTFVK